MIMIFLSRLFFNLESTYRFWAQGIQGAKPSVFDSRGQWAHCRTEVKVSKLSFNINGFYYINFSPLIPNPTPLPPEKCSISLIIT